MNPSFFETVIVSDELVRTKNPAMVGAGLIRVHIFVICASFQGDSSLRSE